MVTVDSNTRLASLDSAKYRSVYHQAGYDTMIKSYSQGLLIRGRNLFSDALG
jgi:effector-binding domain-containing protein